MLVLEIAAACQLETRRFEIVLDTLNPQFISLSNEKFS